MDRPTRQEQAQAIIGLKAQRMASQILGRRASGRADFEDAFNLEWVDIITEIPDSDALLVLGRNIVGPKDGLYILRDGATYRVYLQEKGENLLQVRGADFDEARDAAIHRLIQLQGLPFVPPGA
ncbi:MAG: hypothetical protein GY926_14025 [bacterium]|nr:hypothetical protein [bacterium]MCP4966336.1 hypothetical protein [bacterium]